MANLHVHFVSKIAAADAHALANALAHHPVPAEGSYIRGPGGEVFRVREVRRVLALDWKEDEHPRGQPGNSGQFAATSGGSKSVEPETKPKAEPKTEAKAAPSSEPVARANPKEHFENLKQKVAKAFEKEGLFVSMTYGEGEGDVPDLALFKLSDFSKVDPETTSPAVKKLWDQLNKANVAAATYKPRPRPVYKPDAAHVKVKQITDPRGYYEDVQTEALIEFADHDIDLITVPGPDYWSSDRLSLIPREGGSRVDPATLSHKLQKLWDNLNDANVTAHRGRPVILTHEEANQVAKLVADHAGYDASTISLRDDDRPFTLGGVEHQTAGLFWPESDGGGRIELFVNHAGASYAAGILSHEIQHGKFHAVMEVYRKEGEEIRQAALGMEPGPNGTWRSRAGGEEYILESNGTIRDEFKDRFPVSTAIDKYWDMDALHKDDGITDYSREHWAAYDNHTSNAELAINETMAEMAMLEWEGSLSRLLWFKNSKSYRPLYNAIKRLYPQIKKQQKAAEPEAVKGYDQFPSDPEKLKQKLGPLGMQVHPFMGGRHVIAEYGKDFSVGINTTTHKWEGFAGPPEHSEKISGVGFASLHAALWKHIEGGGEPAADAEFKEAEHKRDHGKFSSTGGAGKSDDPDTLPPLPGTASIPEGHVRLYHQTRLENLEAIRKEGIQFAHAKGWEGPKAIYADEKGFYGKPSDVPTVEFHIPKERWNPPFVREDVRPEDIVALHYPWHDRAHYVENDPKLKADVLAGKHDNLLDDPDYSDALHYIKRKYGKPAADAAFKEDDHPRGQPGNAGQFASTPSKGVKASGEAPASSSEEDKAHGIERTTRGPGPRPTESPRAGAEGAGRGREGGGERDGVGRRSVSSASAAQSSAAQAASGRPKLTGLPDQPLKIGDRYYVPGPLGQAHDAAEEYMKAADLPYEPLHDYAKVDPAEATRVAKAFDEMKHDPDDPKVKAAYAALAKETLAQWQVIKKTGVKVQWIKEGEEDPYVASLNLVPADARENNHMWEFPTDLGYGTDDTTERHNNPMLQPTDEVIDGHKCVVNDIFRIVHDYFGHFKDGVLFTDDGEENAWRSHMAMYSPLARGAMTSETRGQASWVNHGPHGEQNYGADPHDIVYAPQKIGLMPEWTWHADAGAVRPTVNPKREKAISEAHEGVMKYTNPAGYYLLQRRKAEDTLKRAGIVLEVDPGDFGILGSRKPEILTLRTAKTKQTIDPEELSPEHQAMWSALGEAYKAARSFSSFGKVKEHAARGIYAEVAGAMGMPRHTSTFVFSETRGNDFDLGTRKATSAAEYDPDKDTVTVFAEQVETRDVASILAHELMHQKFQKVMRTTRVETHLVTSMRELVQEDGITSYSKDWWKAAKDGDSTAVLAAVNETLAEMARLEWEGRLEDELDDSDAAFKKLRPTRFELLYDAVNRTYAQSYGRKKKAA